MSFPHAPQDGSSRGQDAAAPYAAPPAPPVAPPGPGFAPVDRHPFTSDRVGQTNVLAILSLVFAFVFAPAGLVLGIMARKQVKRTREEGAGLALAGIIVSAVQIVITVAAVAFFVVIATMTGSATRDTGDLIRDSGTHASAPAPGAAKTARMDALAMVRAQEAFRRANPGVPGYSLDDATTTVGVGPTSVTPHPGNAITVRAAQAGADLPEGGYCVIVTNSDLADPVTWDSVVDGGSFLGDQSDMSPAFGACDQDGMISLP